MRLKEVEKGESFFKQMLFRFISMVSGMRLPDAARIVMYHQDFYGKPMTSWTHAAMRGESSWSVGERELMAAMIANWNTCPFCIDAHGSIAKLELDPTLVNSTLNDFQKANISAKLKSVLNFLKKLTQSPDEISIQDVQITFENKVTHDDLEDAIAIAALFNITVRCANALDFATLNNEESKAAAKRMLKQGYVFGKVKHLGHPNHQNFAKTLRERIFLDNGSTDVKLRKAIAQHTIGNSTIPIETQYNELALKIGEGGYRVTDEMIDDIIIKVGSEKAAFELITAAAVNAGLYRWDKGFEILMK